MVWPCSWIPHPVSTFMPTTSKGQWCGVISLNLFSEAWSQLRSSFLLPERIWSRHTFRLRKALGHWDVLHTSWRHLKRSCNSGEYASSFILSNLDILNTFSILSRVDLPIIHPRCIHFLPTMNQLTGNLSTLMPCCTVCPTAWQEPSYPARSPLPPQHQGEGTIEFSSQPVQETVHSEGGLSMHIEILAIGQTSLLKNTLFNVAA